MQHSICHIRQSILVIVCSSLCFSNALAQQKAQQAQAPPREPAVTFKAEVNYVDVDTVVTDQQGNFVKGLTKDDFEVLEDGKLQKVEMFSYVDLPIARPDQGERLLFAGRRIVNDVKTNQQAQSGRLYVVLLDDLDTSLFRQSVVRKAAHQFIDEHLGTNDVAAVVYTSGRGDASQEFTNDRSLLLAAIDKFVGRKLRSAMLDKIDSQYSQAPLMQSAAAATGANVPTNSNPLAMGSSTDPSINPFTRGDGYPDRTMDTEDFERGFRALRVLEELKDLSDFMGNIHGRRKALVMFSEGIDYDTSDIYGPQESSQVVTATHDAISAAARANVSIFGIDPRGLVGMSADALMADSFGPDSSNNPGPNEMANMQGFAAEVRLSQDSLRSLSEETGGFASFDNDLDPTFDRIVQANSTYYVLGYYPPSHPRDGKFHKIEVRVKRSGVKTFARKGYGDPRGKTPEELAADDSIKLASKMKNGAADTTTPALREVLNSPMQQGGVPMLVQASVFKTATKENAVALTIEIDGAPLHFESRNNGTMFADKVELSYFGLNEQGKSLQGERHEFELTLRPDTYQRARQAGLRVNERFPLAPGRYQLRIGVREAGAEALGTVFYDLQVPDFTNDLLSMSGMLLTAATSPGVPTLMSDNVMSADLLPGPATSRRTFVEGDELALFAELYDNIRGQNHTIAITTRLVAEDGQEVFTSRETRQRPPQENSGPSKFPSNTFSLSKQISLAGVHPGRYLLQIEARLEGRDPKIVTRETVLTVSPMPERNSH